MMGPGFCPSVERARLGAPTPSAGFSPGSFPTPQALDGVVGAGGEIENVSKAL
jgi:hypothetical protein